MIRKQTFRTTMLVALFVAMMPSLLTAQSYEKKTLLTIGDKKITAKEFIDTYEKNNVNSDVIDKKTVEEYLDLFVDFKIKVMEAEALMMDTNASFKKELYGYRQQLAKPYFSNDEITDDLVEEAYGRMQYDVNAAHILIKCDANALPSDTLKAYEKAMGIRERLMKGEDFGALAVELSDDPSARDIEAVPGVRAAYKGNRGELGYFSAFDMVYPFETGVYNTGVGEVSMPVRSSFGYHIIKVNSKTPAMGLIKAAHIFVAANPEMPDSLLSEKVNNIYSEILPDGSNWIEIVRKYSEDKGTINTNGMLSPFRVNNLVPEFITALKGLKNGEISKPVKTSYGYHIVKLVSTTPPADLETERTKIKERVERDMRGQLSEEMVMKRIMKENKFKEYLDVKDTFISTIDSTILKGKYVMSPDVDTAQVLFSMNKMSYTVKDFIDYIMRYQKVQVFTTPGAYAYQLYDRFLQNKVFEYEDMQLEKKYPDFKMLVQEYHDGILLFSLMEDQVWNKAINDTLGLQEFYERNKNDHMWGERVKALVVTCNDAERLSDFEKMVREDVGLDSLHRYIKENKLKTTARMKFYQRGESFNIDSTEWVAGTINIIPSTVDRSTMIIKIEEVRQPEPKTFKEVRGHITSGYQAEIEKQWMQELRAKYPLDVNKKLLNKISKKYNN